MSLAGVQPAHPAAPFAADEQRMLLQVARAGAVFPIAFPGFGEPGPAASRATQARLLSATRRASRQRLTLARAAAGTLIAHGLMGTDQAQFLGAIGRFTQDTAGQPALTAAVALAIATVSRHFSPDSDSAATIWLGGLRRLAQRGSLESALAPWEGQ